MQRYLIDTQILIWSLINPEKLSGNIRKIMLEHVICTSHVSLFEIAIKQKIGKLPDLQISIDSLEKRIVDDGFEMIPLKTAHLNHYNSIPLHADHRDPFDRILLATAFSEGIPIISSDENFELYSGYLKVIHA